MAPANPTGLCGCGCNQVTSVVPHNIRKLGYVAGDHRRYISGHYSRLSPVDYLEQDCGYETPCWIWQLGRRGGYGEAKVDGRQVRAHRLYYERFVGTIPEGLQLDHLCRQRACVNPAHLEPVTGTENVRRGGGTKLTADRVCEIRQRVTKGDRQQTIADDFGVTQTTISNIKVGKSWNNLSKEKNNG